MNGVYSIGLWNVNSWTETNGYGREVLLNHLELDVLVVCESKLLDAKVLNIEGYKWIGKNRLSIKRTAKSGSGGVGVFIKESVYREFYVTIIEVNYEGILVLKLVHKDTGKQIAICSCYLPPEGVIRGQNSQDFFDNLLNIVYETSEMDICIFAGDINARIADMRDYIPNVDNVGQRVNIDDVKNSHGDAFIEFLKESSYCVLNGRCNVPGDNFTFITNRGRSVVDYIFMPQHLINQVTDFHVYPVLQLCNDIGYVPDNKMPDHSIVTCKVNVFEWSLHESEQLGQPHNNVDMSGINTFQPHKVKLDRINDSFMNGCEDMVNDTIRRLEGIHQQQDEIDLIYDDICQMYTDLMMEKLPKIGSDKMNKKWKRFIPKPWWNDELQEKWNLSVKKEKEYVSSKGNKKRKEELRMEFKETQKAFDRHYNRAKRKYIRQHAVEIDNIPDNDPKAFWNKINNLGPKKKTQIPMEVDLENEITDDINEVLEKWKRDFSKLYNQGIASDFDDDFMNEAMEMKRQLENMDDAERNNDYDIENEDIMNGDITLEEVRKAISKAKNRKSPGIDGLPNEVYKNEQSLKLIHGLFSFCYRNSLVPSIWQKSVVKPIPKSDMADPRSPLCYRGISLASTLSKLYTGILNTRLTTFIDNNVILEDEQNGFRKARACIDHIFVLASIIRNRKNNSLSTFCCFIDMQKAFDCVSRELLFYKLCEEGVHGKLYMAILAMYRETQSSVCLNGYLTGWFHTAMGVKQGDVMSPSLFNVLINDLAKNIKSAEIGVHYGDEVLAILLYADDIVIMTETEMELQSLLDITSSWCKKWRLHINADKTKVVHFRKDSHPLTQAKFKCCNLDINIIDRYKYLGCIFNEHLDFTVTANTLADASGRALGSIISKCLKQNSLLYDTYSKVYNSGVVPIMDYASGVWGYKKYDRPRQIQNRACRAYLGVHRFASNVMVNGDMGWTIPDVRRKLNMLRLWVRIGKMDDDRLTKKVYQWDRSCKNNNWSRDVKRILKDIDKFELWDNEGAEINVKQLLSHAEEKLMDKVKEQWRKNLNSQSKLRTYRLFKNEYKSDNYVHMNLSKSIRSKLAKLRSGTLPLRIETGRFERIDVDERVCKFCDVIPPCVETEYHFMFECARYINLRVVFLNHVLRFYPNFVNLEVSQKWDIVMNDKTIIAKTGHYICNAMELRNSIIFQS